MRSLLLCGIIGVIMLVGCSSDRNFSGTASEFPWQNECECDVGPDEFVPVEVIAQMVYYQQPEYPVLAIYQRQEGTTWVRALVSTDGLIKDAIISKSSGHPMLDEAALAAAPECVFTPAIQNGQPVCMWVTYQVEFDLPEIQHL